MKKTILLLIIGMLLTATLTATAVFEWNPDEPFLWRDTPALTLPDGPMLWRGAPTFTVSEPVGPFDPDGAVTYRWPYIRLPYPIVKWPWSIIPIPYDPPIIKIPDLIIIPIPEPPIVEIPGPIVWET